MPQLQKVSKKVFAEIVETSEKKASYKSFLEIDMDLGLPESNELKELKEMYDDLTSKTKNDINQLAAIEEIIIQIRCKNVIDSEIRLSLSRNYIYARSIFYRRGVQINDIRTIVGDTALWGNDLNVLLTTDTFRKLAIEKLIMVMDKEITKNINQLKIEV